jgi:asparagine synthase (glutamine-hydrolysing)
MSLPSRTDRTTRIGEFLRTAKRIARGLDGTDGSAYVALTQVGSLEKTAPLVRRPTDPARFTVPLLRAFEDAGGSQIQRHIVCDMLNSLPNDMLTKVDRASMACHLEARVPLLDHRIAEAGAGLPSRFTLGNKGKAVLKALYERKFGRALARRRKQGFGVPVEKWLRGHLAPECDRLFDERRLDRYGILSSSELGGGRWRAWAQRDPQLLWHAFALAVWCEQSH